MIDVQVKILNPKVRDWGLPAYGSDMAAGLDLYAAIDAPETVAPQAPAVLIPTGIAAYIGDPGYVAMIYPRSGLGHKKGLVLGNGTGVIDADYQGQIFVSAWNRNPTGEPITVQPGDRIAQLVILPVKRATLRLVTDFETESVRGAGGFGSSGVGTPTAA
ncbi:aminotransferase [Rhodovibrio sodomensis]|uniref:Deoxyuridine 5'-triphosphate nucleotidohydrolase n=1 Tax=Rhodovibrio sodomensis TaxID=1088 RepID=A0ABS1DAM4_9PROT|nr:dUTP diphosphatase [Rhodovibrio sodomensis]MBK1666470.1 aminotransferase [Rhodovibrio sodomensis]